MKNIVKLLSSEKDYRIIIADTSQIAKKQLNNFHGTSSIRIFLEKIITNCTLFSAMNDFNTKTSFSFHLSNDISIHCKISSSKFQIDYSNSLNEFNGAVIELFDRNSRLSITTGDWETGLNTGTVEAHMDDPSTLFSYFAAQSEQLPSHFIIAGNNVSRGVMIQPLPFADELQTLIRDNELVYLSHQLEEASWNNVKHTFSHIANVIVETEIE